MHVNIDEQSLGEVSMRIREDCWKKLIKVKIMLLEATGGATWIPQNVCVAVSRVVPEAAEANLAKRRARVDGISSGKNSREKTYKHASEKGTSFWETRS